LFFIAATTYHHEMTVYLLRFVPFMLIYNKLRTFESPLDHKYLDMRIRVRDSNEEIGHSIYTVYILYFITNFHPYPPTLK